MRRGSDGAIALGEAVLLFDGVCNLCNGAVLFVIDRDPEGYFRFAPLQSDFAQRLLDHHGCGEADLSSMVLLEEGRCYTRSTAALRIARRLPGLWPLLFAFIVVPRPVRDAVYDWIARNRYRWFGRTESCRIPTPALSGRFLAR
ncbi:thiol-disulfide oxidoreductase DCC family protein [soil metagenome]|nr:thiol-disulfide oxidoreductase DCC family protein [Gemmatimonadota bacterium]